MRKFFVLLACIASLAVSAQREERQKDTILGEALRTIPASKTRCSDFEKDLRTIGTLAKDLYTKCLKNKAGKVHEKTGQFFYEFNDTLFVFKEEEGMSRSIDLDTKKQKFSLTLVPKDDHFCTAFYIYEKKMTIYYGRERTMDSTGRATLNSYFLGQNEVSLKNFEKRVKEIISILKKQLSMLNRAQAYIITRPINWSCFLLPKHTNSPFGEFVCL